MNKKVYFIGIGGIGISALARYYNQIGYKVFGSDKLDSELIRKLKDENIDIIIGEDEDRITKDFEKVIYTEAISFKQEELLKARQLNINILTYPQGLGEIVNSRQLISIAGTHGKSTTASMSAIMLKNTNKDFGCIIGTLLKEFDNKNFYLRQSNKKENFFIIEACEYKRSFLNYKPYISIITNIEVDHLDYYKNLEDYINAFKQYVDNIRKGGFLIINGEENNSRQLINIRNDINIIEVYGNFFIIKGEKKIFPKLNIKIPGGHILYDAKLVYIIGYILKIDKKNIIKSLENYSGVWRRMEFLGESKNGNIFISDYGHHPTEIKLTLKGIREKYINKEIITIFQPHQYSRTIELLDGFKDCFNNIDKLIIPNIYESRDSKENKDKINVDKLLCNINILDKENGNGIDNTIKRIKELDNNKNIIFVIMGAGDIDNIRYNLEIKK